MKKFLALILTLSLVCMILGASADGLNLDGITDTSVVISTENSIPEKEIVSISKGIRTTDTVTDKGDVLTIQTNFGVTMNCTVPNNTAYLTQDYFHDIDNYNRYVNKPSEMIQKFIEDEVHLNLFTISGSYLDAYFHVYEGENPMAQIVGNANELAEDDAAQIAAYLGQINDVEFEYGTVGGQVWFIASLIANNNMLVGFTYVNGYLVSAYLYNIATEEDVATALNLLASVSFS